MSRYESDGKFAAQFDFQESPAELMQHVVEGFEAVTLLIASKHPRCSHEKWTLDYLETGLKLLGFGDTACLVKRDFTRAARVFAEEIRAKSSR